MKKILSMLAVLLCICANAQTSDLTKEVEETLKQQARVKVDELTNHISFIMQKSGYGDEIKDFHIQAALNLFLGKGKTYSDKYGNIQPAPRMQVSSINRSTGAVNVRDFPVATYLSNLKYLSYDQVEITNSKSTFITNLQKVGEDEYEAVLSWVQIFIGKKGDMVIYKDKTKKNIVVRMQKKSYGGIVRWDVLLGDTTAAVTE